MKTDPISEPIMIGNDCRYWHIQCEKCGCSQQIMDWNGNPHQMRCGEDARAVLMVSSEELDNIIKWSTPSHGSVGFDIGYVSDDQPQRVSCHVALATRILQDRKHNDRLERIRNSFYEARNALGRDAGSDDDASFMINFSDFKYLLGRIDAKIR